MYWRSAIGLSNRQAFEKFKKFPARWQRKIAGIVASSEFQSAQVAQAIAERGNFGVLALADDLAFPVTVSDSEIIGEAERVAKDLRSAEHGSAIMKPNLIRDRVIKICARFGAELPRDKGAKTDALSPVQWARLTCPLWWRRTIRRGHARRCEAAAIKIGLVHAGADKYASLESRRRVTEAMRRNAAVLNDTIAKSNVGDECTLAEIAAGSVSNPLIRRGELMVRVRGMEELARVGHAAEFATITCPSRMHRVLWDGSINEKYDGTTPSEAQKYLVAVWALIRSALAKAGVRVFGMRVAEPHHDGCPHWHLLLFMTHEDGTAAAVLAFREIVEKYALADSPGESGASRHRCKFVAIDAAKGTAAGYIAKYIAKNLGFDVEKMSQQNPEKQPFPESSNIVTGDCRRDRCEISRGIYGNSDFPIFEMVPSVIAWSRAHGIRQFQQIGNPPVGLWRQLRAIPEEIAESASEYVHAACVAARRDDESPADWSAYVRAVGGIYGSRKELRVTIAKGFSMKPGRYGGYVGLVAVGVADSANVLYFRNCKSWSFDYKPAREATWTRFNNCTERKMNHGSSNPQVPSTIAGSVGNKSAPSGHSRSCDGQTASLQRQGDNR
jgi:hypothetical protein